MPSRVSWGTGLLDAALNPGSGDSCVLCRALELLEILGLFCISSLGPQQMLGGSVPALVKLVLKQFTFSWLRGQVARLDVTKYLSLQRELVTKLLEAAGGSYRSRTGTTLPATKTPPDTHPTHLTKHRSVSDSS